MQAERERERERALMLTLSQFTDSLLLSLVTLLSTAAYVYLPDHVKSICGHIYYYWAGDRPISDYLLSPSALLRDNTTKTLEVIYETAQGAAAAAAATVRVADL